MVQALHHLSNPEQFYADMKTQPDALKEGIETITQTCIDFSKACIDEGATGIFFGIGGGGEIWSRMKKEELEEYALKYDKKLLKSIQDAPIKFLHICNNLEENPQKNGGLFEDGWFRKYPVDAINWWDTDPSFTSAKKAKKIYGNDFCIAAGISHRTTLLNGTPEQVEKEVKASIMDAGKDGGFIIGPGCTLRQETPYENYNAVGRAVEKYGKY
jgi:uroporphyrinogen decarboxylase